MKWTFQNEARWMLWIGLIPAILIFFAVVLPRLFR
jgi:hypothetical protein